MNKLLEKLLGINEDASGLRSLYKIYKGQEKRLDPDPSDLFNALSMMEEYCKRYLKLLPGDIDIQKRLQEVRQALKSRDNSKQMIALDNIVNQFHMNYGDLLAVGEEMGEEIDPELLNLTAEIGEVLERLGRL